jgi:hypothetical protein
MRPVSIALVVLAATALAGCSNLRSAAGLTKESPDEFAVVTKAPLIIPPGFNLRPPSPGAAPLNQQDPNAVAQSAMFNNNDPITVAQGMTGNYTMGERMLLANAGVQNADPSIRGQLQSDGRNMQGADPAFTNKVLSNTTDPSLRRPVAPAKKSSGWFDWF